MASGSSSTIAISRACTRHAARASARGRRRTARPASTSSTRSGQLAATATTETTNWCLLTGLVPDTRYTYEVIVNDEVWAEGDRYDWQPGAEQGLVRGASGYHNTFRTHPSADERLAVPITFAVIGDFGIGVRRSSPTRRQREIAAALARAVERHDVRFILTTGDNIYAGRRLFGHSDRRPW